MKKTPTDAAAGRLDKLERECRRWKIMSIAALVVGSITALTISVMRPSGKPALIEADRIVLRDKDGRVRAVLEVRPDGTPALAFCDEQERNRLLVGVGRDGAAGLDVFRPDGKDHVALGAWADGGGGLKVFDPDGRNRAAVGVGPDGTPTPSIRDEAGKARLPQR